MTPADSDGDMATEIAAATGRGKGQIAIHYTMTLADSDGDMETTQDMDMPQRALPDRGRSTAPSNSSQTRPKVQPDATKKPDRSRSPDK